VGKVTQKKRWEHFNSLIKIEWEKLRRNPKYKADFEKLHGLIRTHHSSSPKALKKFKEKYHVKPLNPKLTYEEIFTIWRNGLKLGYEHPFPLEVLYSKGEHNFPIYVHKTQRSKIFIKKPLSPLSDISSSLNGVLDNRGVKGSKAKSSQQPFQKPPEICSDGIYLHLNLKATKNSIISAVKKLLLSQRVKTAVRSKSIRTQERRIAAYDELKKQKESDPHKLLSEIAVALSKHYPLKSYYKKGKLLSDDFRAISSEIEPQKKSRKREALQWLSPHYCKKCNKKETCKRPCIRVQEDLKQRTKTSTHLRFVGDASEVDASLISSVRARLKKEPERSLATANRQEKIDLLDYRKADEISPAKVYSTLEYSQGDLELLVPSLSPHRKK